MDALSILTAIAHAALLARMWRGHLFSAWPWFTAYLVLNLARGFALAGAAAYSAGNRGSLVYGLTWMISEPVILVMWVLMARELYLRVCDRYPGIGSFAWWFLLGAISIAVIVAGFTRVDWFAINWTAPAMSLTFFSRRIIATLCALVLVSTWLFFSRFPEPGFPPNLIWHGRIMAVYFAIQSVAYFGATLWQAPATWGRVSTLGAIACYSFWAVALTAKGQLSPTRVISSEVEPLAVADARMTAILSTLRQAAR